MEGGYMRKLWMIVVMGSLLSVCSVPVLAQDSEEDGDYKALMQKTTNNANGICIDYLNSEHGDYSGDKMIESRPPDEVTRGLSKLFGMNARSTPRNGWTRLCPMSDLLMHGNCHRLSKE